MSIFLEITQLDNGDVVLREAQNDDSEPDEVGEASVASANGSADPEPLVRISFSNEVKDMLGSELVEVAEAMIDAATDYLGTETVELGEETTPSAPVIH